jgi:hypothetical protein
MPDKGGLMLDKASWTLVPGKGLMPYKWGLRPGKGWTSVPDEGSMPGNEANINMFESS